jgi:hypothetical protein
MLGLARDYGRDNGTGSDAGLDGNGEADIPTYGSQFKTRILQIEAESEHEEGSVARDSLDDNQSGEDQDFVDPDEAVHERFRQDFLMQASAEDLQMPIGKAWNPDFCVFVDFFDLCFYFCQILFCYDCYETFKYIAYQSEARFETIFSKQIC